MASALTSFVACGANLASVVTKALKFTRPSPSVGNSPTSRGASGLIAISGMIIRSSDPRVPFPARSKRRNRLYSDLISRGANPDRSCSSCTSSGRRSMLEEAPMVGGGEQHKHPTRQVVQRTKVLAVAGVGLRSCNATRTRARETFTCTEPRLFAGRGGEAWRALRPRDFFGFPNLVRVHA